MFVHKIEIYHRTNIFSSFKKYG